MSDDPRGAEVVDGELHADVLQPAQRLGRGLEVVLQRALGHLEAQRRGVDAGIARGAGHHLGEVGPLQLARRHVGRDRERHVVAGVAGGAGDVARLREDPRAHRHDDAGLLGHPQEVARRHDAAHRVVPAQERLDRDAVTGGEVELGLEQHPQLVAVERAPERALGEQARHGLGVHRLVEELVARAAASLGAVHRRVGVLQEARRALRRPVGDRDADAGRHRDLGARERERFGERLRGALGQLGGLLLAAQVLAEHHELVAADAGDGVLATHGRGQAAAHRHQQLVAGLVAEAVVDQLEAVEVDEEHGDVGVVVGLGEPVQGVLEAVLRERPVREAGERVVEREAPELLRARVAVDRERGEVAGAFEDRQFARARLAHGAHEEGEQPEELRAVGRADGDGPQAPQPVAEAERVELGSRALVLDVAQHARLGGAEERLDVGQGGVRGDLLRRSRRAGSAPPPTRARDVPSRGAGSNRPRRGCSARAPGRAQRASRGPEPRRGSARTRGSRRCRTRWPACGR